MQKMEDLNGEFRKINNCKEQLYKDLFKIEFNSKRTNDFNIYILHFFRRSFLVLNEELVIRERPSQWRRNCVWHSLFTIISMMKHALHHNWITRSSLSSARATETVQSSTQTTLNSICGSNAARNYLFNFQYIRQPSNWFNR